eukprot:scaffold72998_cov65-Phaeocystis_antarctica.AAC.2
MPNIYGASTTADASVGDRSCLSRRSCMPAALMAPRPCALAMRTSTGSDVWMRSAKTASDSMSSAAAASTFIRAIGSVCLQREKQTGTATFKCT